MSINNKRQYEMILNVDSSVTVPTMQVYNTDENIFDLKVYVTVNENNRPRKLNHDELQNYKLTLQVVKPVSNQYKEVEGVLDGAENFFLFEIPKTLSDKVGTYKCQIKVTDDKGDGDGGNDEILTSKVFRYQVKPSLLTGISPDIDTTPEIPILESLINEVKIAGGLTVDDPNTIIGGLTIPTLSTTDKTLQGAINELNNRGGATDNNYSNTDKDKVDKIGTEILDTTAQTITEAINELNSKEHIERANKIVTGNALTIGKEHYQQFTINADTVATLPTDLAYRRIVLYVNCTTKDSILTLKYTKDANTDEIKFKLKQDSLNIFTLDCNETSFVVTKESSEDAVLTSTEEQNGIQI